MNALAPQFADKSGLWLLRARIFSGLVLFAYITLHFMNHALGLYSYALQEAVGAWFAAIWRSLPMSVLLYGALVVHVLATLARFYTRRSLKLEAREWGQLLSGLLLPIVMATHVMGTRFAHEFYGVNDSYAYVLFATFVASPLNGWLNVLGLTLAWVHGCVGVHFWLRFKRFYSPTWRNIGLALAVLLPTLALAGYLSAAREIAVLAQSGEWLGAFFERLGVTDDAVWVSIGERTEIARWTILVVLALFFAARLWRWASQRQVVRINIDYVDGPSIRLAPGATLLDTSRMFGVPHASVCGGRGRCSTCRVLVLDDNGDNPAPAEAERRLLERVRAPGGVRLACQWTPEDDVRVVRLLPPDASVAQAVTAEPWASGQEKVVTILFADLRDFTQTSENKLPFDVVYLINQFSRATGKAVERHNGRIDKFLGDGLMAIFGIEGEPAKGANEALRAAMAMSEALAELNGRLESDLDQPLRMGLGIHTGPVVLGNMGYGASRGLTAIGDTVNTASRLEAETKAQGCLLCVSQQTLDAAGTTLSENMRHTIAVRGRQAEMTIYAVGDLAAIVEKSTNAPSS